jgi:hypothetical protein
MELSAKAAFLPAKIQQRFVQPLVQQIATTVNPVTQPHLRYLSHWKYFTHGVNPGRDSFP